MQDSRWIDVDEAEHAGERSALDFLKANLPAEEPFRAWASFEFPRKRGFAQVDCLVVGPRAVFLVEIKNWNGELYGDSMRWKHIRSYKRGTEENPLALANRKARWLKGALSKSKPFRAEGAPAVPRVEALVFMAGDDFNCRLDGDAREAIHGYGEALRPEGFRQDGGLTGIVEAILGFEGGAPVDAALSERVAKAMSSIGIVPSDRFSQVGPAVLGRQLSQTDDVAVFEAHDESAPEVGYRVVFHNPQVADPADPDQATRAALREYRLLSPAETTNAGLPRAVALDAENPRGPAIVFASHAGARSLDRFLEEEADNLDSEDRLALIRKLGETLDYAHRMRMFHRALRPEVIHVHRDAEGEWQPVITGWHTGLRDEAAEGGPGAVTGTSHFTDENRSWLRYRAPEFMAATPSPRLLDVFSLGALAYLILSGAEPPEDQASAFLAAGGYLDPRAADPSLDPAICAEIGAATAENVEERTETVAELLADLGTATSQTASEPTEPAEPPAGSPRDPAELQAGWEIDRFKVTQRLGVGSSGAAAIAVREDGRIGVLKVARSSDYDERIADEGRLLAGIRSRTVIELLEGPFDLEGRQALFLSEADKGTLRDLIREAGAQPVADVARWGDDLLSALEDLERLGQHHRDIKPDNVGLMQLLEGDQAILMDFSLASAPLDEIYLGTEPYRDPFLDERPELCFDAAGDRYAAAVVLHEVLTGEVPRWGDGRNVPRLCELVLATDAFPEEHADALVSFFTRALDKDLGQRFSSARSMARDWADIFDSAPGSLPGVSAEPVTVPETEPVEPAAAPGVEGQAEGVPPDAAALVINMTAQRFSISFRKARGQVTDEEVSAVESLLEEVPASELNYLPSKKRWILDATAETAALLFEVSEARECAIRDRARRVMEFRLAERPDLEEQRTGDREEPETSLSDRETQPMTRLGIFEMTGSLGGEDFVGTTPSKVERVPGRRSVYRLRLLPEVAVDEDVGLQIAYEKFENGERQVRVLDACGSGPRFELLTSRNRLSVIDHEGRLRLDLAQARISKPAEDPDRAGLFNADRELLDDGAATDVLGRLKELGAVDVGLKSEVLGTEGPTSNRYCAVVEREDDLTPVAAYVMTRVAPVYQRIPK